MPYTIAWNESVPAGTAPANQIWLYIQQKQIATRERLDDIFGTSGATGIQTADPYRPVVLKLSGAAAAKIIPGATSFAVRDSTDAQNNLIILENGNSTIRGTLAVSKAAGAARISVASAATTNIDLSTGNSVALTMGASITTLNLNNPVAGSFYVLEVIQSGAFTITWPGSVKWTAGIPPTLSGTGKTDIISLYYNGTNFFGIFAGPNYTT